MTKKKVKSTGLIFFISRDLYLVLAIIKLLQGERDFFKFDESVLFDLKVFLVGVHELQVEGKLLFLEIDVAELKQCLFRYFFVK